MSGTISSTHVKYFIFTTSWFMSNGMIKIPAYNIFWLVKNEEIFCFCLCFRLFLCLCCFHGTNVCFFLSFVSNFYQYIFRSTMKVLMSLILILLFYHC